MEYVSGLIFVNSFCAADILGYFRTPSHKMVDWRIATRWTAKEVWACCYSKSVHVCVCVCPCVCQLVENTLLHLAAASWGLTVRMYRKSMFIRNWMDSCWSVRLVHWYPSYISIQLFLSAVVCYSCVCFKSLPHYWKHSWNTTTVCWALQSFFPEM